MMAVPDGRTPLAGEGGAMMLERWKLLRTLGAAAGDAAAARAARVTLGLPPCGGTEHAEVFAVNCPPYASMYLGAAATGRLAAFRAAIGLDAPPEPDHLTALLDLYTRLGEAAAESGQLRQAQLRQTLFREHLWPWLPAFLGAVSDLPACPLTPWAALTLRALRQERETDLGWDGPLPLALREAPPADGGDGPGELLDRLLTPLRSGMILTRRAVAAGADQVGAGQRIGNRRRALGAMLAAEPEGAADWLAAEADRWSRRHLAVIPGEIGDRVQQWWAGRAARTARLLRTGYPVITGASAADRLTR